jgi:23S rRNA pseudouridine2605 synthase
VLFRSPKRNFKRNDDERPKRNFKRNDDERPKRNFKRNDDERPKRNFKRNDDERPKRNFKRNDDERPKRNFKRNDDERPKRNFKRNDDERPKRNFKRNDDERPKRVFEQDNEFSHKRKFSDDTERTSRYSVRVSEPVDSRVRRKQKEAKAIAKPAVIEVENDKIRLNKFISNSGVCSRREADEFIQAGVVSVNGIVVTELGMKVSPEDEIRFNGELLHGVKKIYLLMNKPKGFVTTTDDPHAEKTVMDIVRNYCTERIYPVGRLDKNTTGVLLFTNDGELAKTLTHPSYGKKKIYAVGLDQNLTKNDMTRLTDGVELEDGISFFDEIAYSNDNDKTKIGVEIHSGKNRIVRRMFEQLGYKVTKLDRVYFAGLTKSKLRRGECRFLSEPEIAMLKMGRYE